jgi:hypothetical protein
MVLGVALGGTFPVKPCINDEDERVRSNSRASSRER